MYIEHPYKYDGKYYANVDGKMIEITKEVAYAMNNFYRSSQPGKVEIKNEKGEIVERKLREIPYSETNGQDYEFSIEDFPDYIGLSGIAKRYGYQNVQEFYRTYHKSHSVYAKYREQVDEWEKTYGEDNQKQDKRSVLERLKNPLKKTIDHQHQSAVKGKDRGAR